MKKSISLAAALLPLAALIGGAVPAQTQTTLNLQLPVLNPVPRTTEIPFKHPKVHYQQWYEGAQFAATIKQPVRIVGVEFFGAIPNGATLDMEVTMVYAPFTLSGNFQQNFISNTVTVLPRTSVAAGPTTMINFANHWVYDGTSNVVVDIKIFGNGTGNTIAYSGTSTISVLSNVQRQYFIGDPNATVANGVGGLRFGLDTRFYYQEGGNYPFGTGCPGGLNVTPVGSANAVPMPGLATYTQLVNKAGAGYPAAWVLGVSNTMAGGVPLPLPMGFLFAPNCNLQVSIDVVAMTTTVGGGPGTGSARLSTPVPPVGNIGGVIVYSQWFIFDKAALNGNLSAAPPVMHVIGS